MLLYLSFLLLSITNAIPEPQKKEEYNTWPEMEECARNYTQIFIVNAFRFVFMGMSLTNEGEEKFETCFNQARENWKDDLFNGSMIDKKALHETRKRFISESMKYGWIPPSLDLWVSQLRMDMMFPPGSIRPVSDIIRVLLVLLQNQVDHSASNAVLLDPEYQQFWDLFSLSTNHYHKLDRDSSLLKSSLPCIREYLINNEMDVVLYSRLMNAVLEYHNEKFYSSLEVFQYRENK